MMFTRTKDFATFEPTRVILGASFSGRRSNPRSIADEKEGTAERDC